MAAVATKAFWSQPDPDDPLSQALQPPPNESPEDRAARIRQQEDAIRVSKEIDDEIAIAKRAYERRKKAIKILLLGQAESGKSTTLKNFQLAFSPQHFHKERSAWKTIIQLNLIRNIKRLLEVLQEEWESSLQTTTTASIAKGKGVAGRTPTSPGVRFSTSPLTDNHRRIRMRLSALLPIEDELMKKLLPDGAAAVKDVCVRAGSGWKGILTALSANTSTLGPVTPAKPQLQLVSAMKGGSNPSSRPGTADAAKFKDNPTAVLAACKDDIVTLWEDPIVRGVLKKHNVRLQDMPGFFLNDAGRVAAMSYEPTDDDIVRARVRTLGVEEHHFTMESGALPGTEWYIYDVGGSRSVRQHWIPYFDDVQAIIFLAPLAFNLTLEEDPKVNRLEDSITLWREVCTNALLAKTTLILFLNKMDILQATLASGIRVVKYVPSYGDQPNDITHVTKYFRDKFRGYHKRLSPKARPFYWHETSVIDTRSTAAILVGVREGILRAHLQSVNVI
ncbi:G-protein alpha subunit [Dichomitus squalens LYAD-421 SS1]|uniref:G-protein alpha subunit n=1 Tax=Dichomitus squalens (strain LYAD-421) TaxID=732165 RepID=R7SIS1_DICSQ|nr:G-protein alpha subunit [Dichomitus squalens LYAD-421 SS1]EJF56061.1 G-protein alpha subunit [Dichomitus squalens LYAD-421 SS1]